MEEKQAQYIKAVEESLADKKAVSTGLCPGCEECAKDNGYESLKDFDSDLENGKAFSEGHFSWRGCQICGTSLGGNVEPWHYIDSDGEIVHESRACVDCILFLANGDLPRDWQD